MPQFCGLTACPSIHKFHWFVLARLGHAGYLLSPLVTEVIISTDVNAFVFPCINSTHCMITNLNRRTLVTTLSVYKSIIVVDSNFFLCDDVSEASITYNSSEL